MMISVLIPYAFLKSLTEHSCELGFGKRKIQLLHVMRLCNSQRLLGTPALRLSFQRQLFQKSLAKHLLAYGEQA